MTQKFVRNVGGGKRRQRYSVGRGRTVRANLVGMIREIRSPLTICLTSGQHTTVRLVPQCEAVPDQRNILRGKRKRLPLHPRIIFTAPKRLHDPCVSMAIASSEQVGKLVHENMPQHIAQKEPCRSGRVEAPQAVAEDVDVSAFVCERICQYTGAKSIFRLMSLVPATGRRTEHAREPFRTSLGRVPSGSRDGETGC